MISEGSEPSSPGAPRHSNSPESSPDAPAPSYHSPDGGPVSQAGPIDSSPVEQAHSWDWQELPAASRSPGTAAPEGASPDPEGAASQPAPAAPAGQAPHPPRPAALPEPAADAPTAEPAMQPAPSLPAACVEGATAAAADAGPAGGGCDPSQLAPSLPADCIMAEDAPMPDSRPLRGMIADSEPWPCSQPDLERAEDAARADIQPAHGIPPTPPAPASLPAVSAAADEAPMPDLRPADPIMAPAEPVPSHSAGPDMAAVAAGADPRPSGVDAPVPESPTHVPVNRHAPATASAAGMRLPAAGTSSVDEAAGAPVADASPPRTQPASPEPPTCQPADPATADARMPDPMPAGLASDASVPSAADADEVTDALMAKASNAPPASHPSSPAESQHRGRAPPAPAQLRPEPFWGMPDKPPPMLTQAPELLSQGAAAVQPGDQFSPLPGTAAQRQHVPMPAAGGPLSGRCVEQSQEAGIEVSWSFRHGKWLVSL